MTITHATRLRQTIRIVPLRSRPRGASLVLAISTWGRGVTGAAETLSLHANRSLIILNYFRYHVVMRVTEHPFSDLLRRPREVTQEVDEGDVLLRRRGEPDLRLSRADRETHRAEAFGALGRAMRNLAVHNPRALGDALDDAFPWLELLPSRDRRVFLEEFSRVVTAAASLDSYEPLTQLVREWRATAEVHADPKLARRLRRPLDADGEHVALPSS
jgi:hypothetical protein